MSLILEKSVDYLPKFVNIVVEVSLMVTATSYHSNFSTLSNLTDVYFFNFTFKTGNLLLCAIKFSYMSWAVRNPKKYITANMIQIQVNSNQRFLKEAIPKSNCCQKSH